MYAASVSNKFNSLVLASVRDSKMKKNNSPIEVFYYTVVTLYRSRTIELSEYRFVGVYSCRTKGMPQYRTL